MKKTGLGCFLFCISILMCSAQSITVVTPGVVPESALTEAQHQQLEQVWQQVLQRRPASGVLRSTEKLIWPVRQADGFDFIDIYALAAYVDHDERKPNHLLDYQCGSFTADGTSHNHAGTDIMLWPFGWQQMDIDQAEVIAAAGGEIVYKADGEYDQNCPFRFVFSEGNALFIRHDDGTTAMYLNLKAGSLTDKSEGQRVQQGEFLGVVGSSGNSLYPHLHFELRSPEGTVIDPFSGPCNPGESRWQQQPAYLESGVNLLATALEPPNFNNFCNPATWAPQSEFAPGDSLYFLAFTRQTRQGQLVRMSVQYPDGTALTDRSTNLERSSARSYFIHAATLPDNAPSGTYTCRMFYLDQEFQTTFRVLGSGSCLAPAQGELVSEVFSATEVRLRYDDSQYAAYQWQLRREGDSNWVDIPTEAHNFFLRGLQAGTTYEYRVRYWCGQEWSPWSSPSQFTTLPQVSCPTVDLNQTQVTFPDPTQATIAITVPGRDAYDWRIQPPDDRWYNVISQADSTYTFSDLAPGTTYQYAVRVRCGNTWSNWSASGSFTTPATTDCPPPGTADIQITPLSATEVMLTALNRNKERYDWRIRPLGSTGWISIPSTTAASIILQGLSPSASYEIQHRWICEEAWSDWSESIEYQSPGTPCPDVTTDQIQISFPREGFVRVAIQITGDRGAYQVRYRLSTQNEWTTLSATSQSSVDIPVAPESSYEVQVRTFCRDDWSNWSGSVSFTTPPVFVCPSLALSHTSVALLSPTQVNITINPPAEIDQVQLRFRKNSATQWTERPLGENTLFTLSDLSPNTAYAFQVRGSCAQDVTDWSETGFFTTLPQPVCQALDTTDFSATALSEHQIQVTIHTDTAQRYQVRYRPAGATSWQSLSAADGVEFLLNNLASAQIYEIQVRQECRNNLWSDWSPIVTGRTLEPYVCPQPDLQDVTVFDIQTTRATLLYTGNAGLLFQWRYRLLGTTAWTTLPAVATATQVLSELLPTSIYEYQIRIDCGRGWSNWSDSDRLTTLTPPPPCTTPMVNQIDVYLLPNIQSVRIFVADIDANAYQWRLRPQGQTSWTRNGESPDNNWLIEGIPGETTFDLQVRVLCASGWTAWSAIQQFTTPSHQICTDPTAAQMQVTSLSFQEATIQITQEDAPDMQLQYRTQGITTWTTADVPANGTFRLTGLQPETTYQIRYRYECTDGWSVWSSIKVFTTPADTSCPDPVDSDSRVSLTTATSATLENLLPNLSEWQIQYRPQDAETWVSTLLRTTPVVRINNLIPLTTYVYRFRYECADRWSTWSPLKTFTTQDEAICPDPTEVDSRVQNLSATTATIENLIQDLTDWQIQYRPQSNSAWGATLMNTTPVITLDELLPFTSYTYRFRYECADGWSAWSPEITFTTLEAEQIACMAPEPTESEAGLSHIVLHWKPTGTHQQYEVRLRDIYAPDWQRWSDLRDTAWAVTGLEPCTNYEWQVRMICDTLRSSDWSPVQEVATSGCSADYCYSYGLGEAAFIHSVEINQFTHVSGNDYGYADHTGQEIRFPEDEPLQISVQADLPNDTIVANTLYWRIWLDRNQDGDFLDADEQVLEQTTPVDQLLHASIAHNLRASSLPYRIRIGVSPQRYPQVCAVESTKYVEDYQLFLDLAQNPIRQEMRSGQKGIQDITPAGFPAVAERGTVVGRPYPNPFLDLIHLPIQLAQPETISWHLTTAHGRQIRQGQMRLEAGIHVFPLPLESLPPGYYNIQLRTKTATSIFRLVKGR